MGLNWFSKRKSKGEAGKVSYSQCGEDLIADFVLTNILKLKSPRYLDVGAHDPVRFNNTYYFYQRGLSGVLVEPNRKRCDALRQARPRDTVIHAGAGPEAGVLTYYELDPDTLNTFNSREAEEYQKAGHRLTATSEVEIRSIASILEQFGGTGPDFVSLDVEGGEMQILAAWNLDERRPGLFCIETAEYTPDGSGGKRKEVLEFMRAREYRVYADTYINTLFVDSRCWRGHGFVD